VALARRAVATGRPASVVNLALGAAIRARPGAAHYSTSKVALEMLTRSCAVELGAAGIRVNAVSPGFVAGSSQEVNPITEEYAAAVSDNALGRIGQPEDVAAAVFQRSRRRRARSSRRATGFPPRRADWDTERLVVGAQPFARYVVHDAPALLGAADEIATLCLDWADLLKDVPDSVPRVLGGRVVLPRLLVHADPRPRRLHAGYQSGRTRLRRGAGRSQPRPAHVRAGRGADSTRRGFR
jgi:hypothetical protein